MVIVEIQWIHMNFTAECLSWALNNDSPDDELLLHKLTSFTSCWIQSGTVQQPDISAAQFPAGRKATKAHVINPHGHITSWNGNGHYITIGDSILICR